MRKANRFLPSVLLVMILPVLLNTACGSSKYTVTFSECTLPFVTVRETDFRCGPLDLPLTDESRRKISTFLQGGAIGATRRCSISLRPHITTQAVPGSSTTRL